MKILKIFLILLVPAFGFVGCQKSDIKPSCHGHEANAPEQASKAPNDNSPINTGSLQSRSSNSSDEFILDGDLDEDGNEIIGSGDDDRDGGDKKKKLNK